jgi:foldase protein PrsA
VEAGKPLHRFVGVGLVALVLLTGCKSGTQPDPQTVSPSPSPSVGHASPSASVANPKPPWPDGGDPVAVVGGKSITRAELSERLFAMYGADMLQELMLREVVRQESERLGITVTEEELERELRKMSEGYGSEAEFYQAMQRLLGMDRAEVREDARYHLLLVKLATRDVDVPESEIRRYYDEHKQEFGAQLRFELSWILTATKQDAEQLFTSLKAGADFGELARRHSIDDATAEQGGDLGWVERTEPFIDEALLAAAENMRVGEAVGPIQTGQGYALLLLRGKKSTPGKNYEDVRDEIRLQLAMERAQSIQQLQRSLLDKYGARVLDPKLKLPVLEESFY